MIKYAMKFKLEFFIVRDQNKIDAHDDKRISYQIDNKLIWFLLSSRKNFCSFLNEIHEFQSV